MNLDADEKESEAVFKQWVALGRSEAAWNELSSYEKNATKRNVLALASHALGNLDIRLAQNCYRLLGDVGMVESLQTISAAEEKNVLAGHVCVFLGDYTRAQELFLHSNQPELALAMRSDLLQWDQALRLAESLGSKVEAQIPLLTARLAQSMEHHEEYSDALLTYSNAKEALELQVGGDFDDYTIAKSTNVRYSSLTIEECRKMVLDGIARCAIKTGDTNRGVSLALESGDAALKAQCAAILVDSGEVLAAAHMYEEADLYDRAMELYIKRGRTEPAHRIASRVRQPALLQQFAAQCEAAGELLEAFSTYMRARDSASAVRIALKSNRIQEAFTIGRESGDLSAAKVLASFCLDMQPTKNVLGAIEFLIIARDKEKAFELAVEHDEVETYASHLGQELFEASESFKVGRYYELMGVQHYGRAAKYYAMGGETGRALNLYLNSGGGDDLDAAIQLVGKVRNDIMTHQLIDYLLGDTTGAPQDPIYIYRLYFSLGRVVDAAKTAEIIAKQDMDNGRYKDAHGTLVEAIRNLEQRNVHVPQSLRQDFILLHSYLLVKPTLKRGLNLTATKLLERCLNRLSRFPVHDKSIMCTAVLTAQKAGLNDLALKWARELIVMNDYRDSVPQKFQRKVEQIVRKSGRVKLGPESEGLGLLNPAEAGTSLCPLTNLHLADLELTSPGAGKEQLPMCVASGKHMSLEDWMFCPNSGFPAKRSEYFAYLHIHPVDEDTENAGGDKSGAENAMAPPEIGKSRLRTPGSSSRRPRRALGLDPIHHRPVYEDSIPRAPKKEDITKYLSYYCGTKPVPKDVVETEEDIGETTGPETELPQETKVRKGGPADVQAWA
eukprot:scaffold8277_cov277-Pinguiococcus_pyrenoidosus.AAC.1